MSVASLLPLLSRKESGKLKIIVTMTNSDETPDQMPQLTESRGGVYEWRGIATRDGFVRTEFVNPDKHSVPAVVSVIDKPASLPPIKATLPVKFPPIVNTEVPTGDPYDGGTFETVVIVAPTVNGEYSFQASYEANLGSSGTWTVGPAPGGGDGSGSGSGSSDGGDAPGPEEMALVRELNQIEANKCEARYILAHIFDRPLMARDLRNIKDDVNAEMVKQNLSQANIDGASKENAFKHALLYAYLYCELGGTHADNIANYHEECDGINQNASTQIRDMDIFNNARGKDIVQANPLGCDNRNILILAVWQAYLNGVLHDVNGNGTSL